MRQADVGDIDGTRPLRSGAEADELNRLLSPLRARVDVSCLRELPLETSGSVRSRFIVQLLASFLSRGLALTERRSNRSLPPPLVLDYRSSRHSHVGHDMSTRPRSRVRDIQLVRLFLDPECS
jgi:hypothetical protein